jgi:hypothetical protein
MKDVALKFGWALIAVCCLSLVFLIQMSLRDNGYNEVMAELKRVTAQRDALQDKVDGFSCPECELPEEFTWNCLPEREWAEEMSVCCKRVRRANQDRNRYEMWYRQKNDRLKSLRDNVRHCNRLGWEESCLGGLHSEALRW